MRCVCWEEGLVILWHTVYMLVTFPLPLSLFPPPLLLSPFDLFLFPSSLSSPPSLFPLSSHSQWEQNNSSQCSCPPNSRLTHSCTSIYEIIWDNTYSRCCMTVVLWPRLLTFVSLTRHPASYSTALSKVFSRHLQVYQCIRTRTSQQESMWTAKIMDHSSTCTRSYSTEVNQLPHSQQQACFIIDA